LQSKLFFAYRFYGTLNLFYCNSKIQDIIDPSAIKVFPNPASNVLNVDLEALELNGNVNLRIIDITGKVVLESVMHSNDIKTLNLTNIQNGHYMLNISNEDYMIGKRFSVAK